MSSTPRPSSLCSTPPKIAGLIVVIWPSFSPSPSKKPNEELTEECKPRPESKEPTKLFNGTGETRVDETRVDETRNKSSAGCERKGLGDSRPEVMELDPAPLVLVMLPKF
jgi:hypothetical protein